MSTDRPINLEKLYEATDAQLAEAYAAALTKAHDAPKEYDSSGQPRGAMTWATRSREAFRIGDEIERRKTITSRLL